MGENLIYFITFLMTSTYIIFVFLIKQLNINKKEISFLLPMNKEINKIGSEESTIYKHNIYEILPVELKDPRTIILFTLPSCSFCHSALEEFIELNKVKRLPFLNIIGIKKFDNTVKHFLSLYESTIQSILLPVTSIGNLTITSFPTFLLVDKSGQILKRSTLSSEILKDTDIN